MDRLILTTFLALLLLGAEAQASVTICNGTCPPDPDPDPGFPEVVLTNPSVFDVLPGSTTSWYASSDIYAFSPFDEFVVGDLTITTGAGASIDFHESITIGSLTACGPPDPCSFPPGPPPYGDLVLNLLGAPASLSLFAGAVVLITDDPVPTSAPEPSVASLLAVVLALAPAAKIRRRATARSPARLRQASRQRGRDGHRAGACALRRARRGRFRRGP